MRAKKLRGALAGKVLAMSGAHRIGAALPAQCAMAAVVAGALVVMAMPVMAQAQQQARVAFSIPAQPLPAALRAFAAQAKQQLLFDEDKLARLQVPALRGSYTPAEALHQLLAGTGMVATQSSPGLFAIKEAVGGAASGDVLTEVVVTVAPEQDGATERTGSYTQTGASSTATQLGLTLRETPQSVTVVTRQRLDDQKLDSVIDALENTTGVTTFRQGMGTDLTGLWSRGFSISNFLVDGIPSSLGASNYWRNTAMYDRIEVVRGATGLMSGMGTPAASINLARKRPTKETQASVTAEVGSWSRYGLGADLSSSLSEDGRWRGRLVVDDKRQHSWIERYKKQSQLVYGITELDLTPTTLFTAGISHERNNNDAPLRTGLPLSYSNGAATNFGRSTNVAPDWSFYDSEVTNIFSSVKHDLGEGWNGKIELTHTQYKYDSALYFLTGSIDQATGQGASIWPIRWKSNTKQNTLDAQIGGAYQLLGRQHDLVAGISLSQLRGTAPSYGSWMGPWTGYDGTIANIHTWNGSLPSPNFVASGATDTKETQYGAYATSRFQLLDKTKLIAGARVTTWDRVSDTSVVGVAGSTSTKVKETGVVVPYLGLVHDLDENWTVYGSFTRIFSPQSASIRDVNNIVLDPESGNSYEVGVKSSLMDKQLNTSLAFFKTKQNNLANYDAATDSYVALQGIRTKGLEAEISGELAHGWNMAGGYTYSTSVNAQGERAVTQIPRHSIKVFTNYRFPGEWNKLTIGGGVNWQSATGYPGEAQQSAYAVANAMVRYDLNEQFSLAININNLFDKTYYSGLSNYGAVFGAPRNAMLTAKYNF